MQQNLLSRPAPQRLLMWIAICALCLSPLTACSSPRNPQPANPPSSSSETPGPTQSPEHQESTSEPTPQATAGQNAQPDSDESTLSFHRQSSTVNNDGQGWIPVALRTGIHDGFTRSVVEFTDGNGELSYQAHYAPAAYEMGRGHEIKTSGAEVIDIMITNTSYPTEDSHLKKESEITRLQQAGPLSVAYDGIFEGNTHVAIGVPANTRYRIFQLDNPRRLVIDVQTQSQ